MPLKCIKISGSPHYYLRGTIRGKSIYKTTGTSDTKAAEEIRIKTEAELLHASIHGTPLNRSFTVAAVAYMDAPGAPEREQRFVLPLAEFFGHLPLSDISQDRLDQYIATHYKRCSPATVLRNVITPMTSVLNFAARRGWCPQPKFDRPKQPRGRRRWATYEEAASLINACSPSVRRLVIFLLFTGARMSEALDLEWSDVDLNKAWVVFRDTKRDGEDRGIPLAAAALECLGVAGKGAVFLTRHRKPYADKKREAGGQIKTAWKGALQRAGIEGLRPHDLRHTFSTWLTMAGVHEQVRDELMGHASTTMGRRYSHIPRQPLVEAIALLPALIKVGEKSVNKNRVDPIYAVGGK